MSCYLSYKLVNRTKKHLGVHNNFLCICYKINWDVFYSIFQFNIIDISLDFLAFLFYRFVCLYEIYKL